MRGDPDAICDSGGEAGVTENAYAFYLRLKKEAARLRGMLEAGATAAMTPQQIRDKGRLLTAISRFWFEETESVVPHHLVSTDSADFPEPFRSVPELAGRSMLVKKAERVDIECVVRGYIAGSAWKEYERTGACTHAVTAEEVHA